MLWFSTAAGSFGAVPGLSNASCSGLCPIGQWQNAAGTGLVCAFAVQEVDHVIVC